MSVHDSFPDTAAAGWMTRRDAGWSPAEQAEFQAWLHASPENALAWAKVESAWSILDRPREDGLAQTFLRELSLRQRRRKVRQVAFGSVGVAAAALALLLLRPQERRRNETPPAASQFVSSPQRSLPDGSVVDLNRDTEIAVDYSARRRAVTLVRGEAHFDVRPEEARPFVVIARGVEVRAVGTAFIVRLDPDVIDVLVTKGSVAVERPAELDRVSAAAPPASVTISAGDRLAIPNTPAAALPRPETVPESEIARRLDWRGPRLELSGMRLVDAIAILNQKSTVNVIVADDGLGEMRMSGVFRADDLEGFVDVLATNYGVAVERGGDAIVLRQRAKP